MGATAATVSPASRLFTLTPVAVPAAAVSPGLVIQSAHDVPLERRLKRAGATIVHHTDNFYMWRVINADRVGERFGVPAALPASVKPAKPLHNAILKDWSKPVSVLLGCQAAIVYNIGLPTSLHVKPRMGLPREISDDFGQLNGRTGRSS